MLQVSLSAQKRQVQEEQTKHNQFDILLITFIFQIQIMISKLFQEYFSPVSNSTGPQLLQTIKAHENFIQIFQKLTSFPSTSSIPPSFDIEYLTLLLHDSKQRNQNQIYNSLQKLEEVILTLSCLEDQLKQKNNYISSKTKHYLSKKMQVEEDCQILSHQNHKLQQQSKISVKNMDKQKQLEDILRDFECIQTGFPKNKNQANKLLTKLTIEVEKLQLQKLQM